MKNLPKIGLLAVATAVSAPALADDALSYTYIEAAYLDTEIDDGPDVDGDGYGIAGSFELTDALFLTASYADQDFDFGIDSNRWTAGLGAHTPLADNLDLVGEIGYVDAELETGFGDVDDDGYYAGVGLRARVAQHFELEGGLNYVDLDDSGDNTTVNLGGRYYLTDQFAIGAGIDFDDDVKTWQAGFRFEF